MFPLATAWAALRRHSTALAAALFAVVAVSGVLIFFHIGNSLLMGAHEWLGLAFAAATLLHVVRNGQAFTALVARPRFRWSAAAVAVVAAGLMAASATRGPNPAVELARAAERAPLAQLAGVLGVPAVRLVDGLRRQGIAVDDPAASVAAIAQSGGLAPRQVLAAAVTAAR
ncbi:MAG: DUF4405 domain-containing protein [Pseudomonadota bacterium]